MRKAVLKLQKNKAISTLFFMENDGLMKFWNKQPFIWNYARIIGN